MTSENSTSVLSKKTKPDNQQERLRISNWVVGFVDGEGSFLVSIFKSPRAKLGWQIFPEFNVSQTEKSLGLLIDLKNFFGCGNIYIHRTRARKHKKWDVLYRYCVRSRKDLLEKIIPFFENNSPRGKTKKNDFKIFAKVIKEMEKEKHLTMSGMRKIVKMTKNMNHRKPFKQTSAYKFLSSPETIRRASLKQRRRYSPSSTAK